MDGFASNNIPSLLGSKRMIFQDSRKTDWIGRRQIETGAAARRVLNEVVFRYSAGAGKHTENGSKELNDGAVHKRKRSDKPYRQREDGQAIFKAEGSRLVCDKTLDEAFHCAGPP